MMAYNVGLVVVPSLLGTLLFNSGIYDLLVSKLNKCIGTPEKRKNSRKRSKYYALNSDRQNKRILSNDSLMQSSRLEILSQEYEMR